MLMNNFWFWSPYRFSSTEKILTASLIFENGIGIYISFTSQINYYLNQNPSLRK